MVGFLQYIFRVLLIAQNIQRCPVNMAGGLFYYLAKASRSPAFKATKEIDSFISIV